LLAAACAAAVVCVFLVGGGGREPEAAVPFVAEDFAGESFAGEDFLGGDLVAEDFPGDGAEIFFADSGEESRGELIARNLPAPAAGPAFSSGGPAARALATAEAAADAPESPSLLLASLGETVVLLPGLPFLAAVPFSGSPEELAGSPPDGADFVGPLYQGPRFYAGNERYVEEEDGDGLQVLRSVIARGDTAGVILNEWLGASEVAALIAAAEPVHSLADIHEGRPFSVVRRPDSGEFVRFSYETDRFQRLVVTRRDGAFFAEREAIEYETRLVRVRGSIASSLFEAVAEAGEGPALAVELADVFSCEVDFLRELRTGDSFEALVEKLYREGEFVVYGKMLAAHFTNRGKKFEAYLFADAGGNLHYYNAQGEALQKTLLKAPLAYTRVSSGYSMNRRHPVFGYSRPHQGVDYAAPAGTPVKAVGDGLVTMAGWGNGYGNMVVIRHAGGLESQYAHMSGFARGVKAGVRVRQGQTIGYVGATGVATGPHLDFRLRQNGKFLDPAKVIVPRADPVSRERMDEFRLTVAADLAYMTGEASLAEYVPAERPR
jgi:murein DD-endopeptidase MepM/ murein hydrolase activator NlpD